MFAINNFNDIIVEQNYEEGKRSKKDEAHYSSVTLKFQPDDVQATISNDYMVREKKSKDCDKSEEEELYYEAVAIKFEHPDISATTPANNQLLSQALHPSTNMSFGDSIYFLNETKEVLNNDLVANNMSQIKIEVTEEPILDKIRNRKIKKKIKEEIAQLDIMKQNYDGELDFNIPKYSCQGGVKRKEVKEEREKDVRARPYGCQCGAGFQSPEALKQHLVCSNKEQCCPAIQTRLRRTGTGSALLLKRGVPPARDLAAHFKINKNIDQEYQSDDKLKRKRELSNARVKKHREKKRTESQQLNSSMQDDPTEEIRNKQVKENNIERKRALAKERSRRCREKKRFHVLKSVHQMVYDSQILEPAHEIPLFLNINSKISTNYHEDLVRHANQEVDSSLLDGQIQETEGHPLDDDGLLKNHEHVLSSSSTPYTFWAKHYSAHLEFYKQFMHNTFGHACKICDRLWFRNNVKILNDNHLKFVKTFLPSIEDSLVSACVSCRTAIEKNVIPKMAVCNGFAYPAFPDDLLNCPLDVVSERLISPMVPFTQIGRLRHVDDPNTLYSQAVNIPMEINTLVKSLPRSTDDVHCIHIPNKHKGNLEPRFLHSLIRKRIIIKWLHHLANTPLYEAYNITINQKFLNGSCKEGEPSERLFESSKYDNKDLTEVIPIEDSLTCQQQTLIFNDDLYLNQALKDNNIAKGRIFDENAEELSFPSIYLGQNRKFREGIRVTPFIMATSEIRRSDRRGVTPQHLLFMATKIIRIRLRDSVKVAFKYTGKSNITKDHILSEDHDSGGMESNFAFLRSIPNSTWYWSEEKKNLLAMIRQLGKPTVHFTISANEIGWPNLIQLLYKLNKREDITLKEIANLHFMIKSSLVNNDAVTCAIYFNKMLDVLLKILQSRKSSPFGKFRVAYYFQSIEFQHQGSPRAHILAWLNNAPKDFVKDYDNAVELIDAIMSVSESEASGNIKLQQHKHSIACYNKIVNKSQTCGYKAPFMPAKKTIILVPMKDTEEGFSHYRKKYDEIRKQLKNEDFVDFDDFYNSNGINSDEEYYNIIRSGIDKPKVFMKRKPSEKWINPFNPFILNIVKSETDVRLIIDERSCAAYLVKYFSKTNRVSDLRRRIIETVNAHPEVGFKDLLGNISVDILNDNEITSQEAAWYLLREPLCKSSISIPYISTVWPIERRRVGKSIEELKQLDGDSGDVWKEDWFNKYEKRPNHLESVTLAQFVSKYSNIGRGKPIVERNERRVIRYRNYNVATDFNEFRREMVTLHLPFRSEEEEILADLKYISTYDDNEAAISLRRKEFESDIDIEKITEIYRELCRKETAQNKDIITKTEVLTSDQ